jgi:DNA-binding response OmpR family regulator
MITHAVEKRAAVPEKGLAGDTEMDNILVVTADGTTRASLQQAIVEGGFFYAITSYEEALEAITHRRPHLVLAEINSPGITSVQRIIGTMKKEQKLPVIALIPADVLVSLVGLPEVDDFITGAFNKTELLLRIKRLLHTNGGDENGEQIKCDGLTIDLATCEVIVNGARVDLTFKEYEMLKFFATNRGRVFTRQALLDKIWGYDYFGGDRTVDVHIRRLRSKIEDAAHTYIETVRNIGYRFVKNVSPEQP